MHALLLVPVLVISTSPSTCPRLPSTNRLPTVWVQTAAGAQVTLYADEVCEGTPVSAVTLAPSAEAFPIATRVPAPAGGVVRYHARALDAAGNATCSSTFVAYDIDTSPPSIDVMGTRPATTSAQRTRNLLPQVYGVVEPGAAVALHRAADCSDAPLGAATGGADGVFRIQATTPLPTNVVSELRVSARDAAGNATCAGPVEYHTDTAPPTITAVELPPASLTFAVNDAGAFATRCTLDGAPVACRPSAPVADPKTAGVHLYVFTAIDAAGNAASASYRWTR